MKNNRKACDQLYKSAIVFPFLKKNPLNELRSDGSIANKIGAEMDLILISGASTGIGYATAIAFAEKGHFVLAGVRSAKDFGKFSDKDLILPVYLDITDSRHQEQALESIEKKMATSKFEKLVLINNAGVVMDGPWELLSEQEIRSQIEINLFGPILLTKQLLPLLRKTKGQVINISSISGVFASPLLGAYAISKFGLDAFSDSLRREMFKFGVAVNSINPGPIKTPLWQKGFDNPKNELRINDQIYGAQLEKFRQSAINSEKNALDVANVVRAILTAHKNSDRFPRIFVIPLILKIFLFFSKIIPIRIFDRLFKRY